MVKFAKFSAVVAFAAVLAMLGIALSASATHVEPTLLTGNPTCEGGLKIEPVVSGTYPAPPASPSVTIVVSGSSFSFTANGTLVTSVIVKGGPDANLYDYGTGVSSDTGLTAPNNPKSNRPYGLSHLCFFFGEKTPPPPSTSTSTSPTPDPKP